VPGSPLGVARRAFANCWHWAEYRSPALAVSTARPASYWRMGSSAARVPPVNDTATLRIIKILARLRDEH
jgi:hypothetical protein